MAERFPRIRRAPIPADALIVVRGEELGERVSAVQAERFRRRYPDWGRWGLSALVAANEADIDRFGSGLLIRYRLLGLYRVVDLERAGLEIVPTFRTPHVTIAFDGTLEDGLDRVRKSIHELRPNPYHVDERPERHSE